MDVQKQRPEMSWKFRCHLRRELEEQVLLENDILEGEGGPYSLPYPVLYLKGLQIGPHLGPWFCGHEVYCPCLLGMNRIYSVVLIHISLYAQFQKNFHYKL